MLAEVSLCTIFQVGVFNDEKNYPRILQCMHTTVISQPECKRLIAAAQPGLERTVLDGHVCSKKVPRTPAGVCKRDHGGGLITQGEKPELIGLVTWVWGGCTLLTPTYVRVFPLLSFIRGAMQE